MEGMPVIFTDTAGFRKTNNLLEIEGIRRTNKAIETAALKIIFLDINNPFDIESIKKHFSCNDIIAFNKLDKVFYNQKICNKTLQYFLKHNINKQNIFFISLKEGHNVNKLERYIKDIVKSQFSINFSETIIHFRQYNKLKQCSMHLKNALKKTHYLEIMAEHIHLALDDIGALLGKIDTEEILDEIFTSFCIGK